VPTSEAGPSTERYVAPAGISPRPSQPEDGADDGIGASGRLPDRERLVDAMERSGWVQAKAARILGLTPRQIGYALRRHNIPVKKF
jgi:Nif-specific regulatory protein